jgi:hypothetical protein
MKKLVFIMAAAMALTATQSFAHDKGKKKCGSDCCKKETKVTVKKATVAAKKA